MGAFCWLSFMARTKPGPPGKRLELSSGALQLFCWTEGREVWAGREGGGRGRWKRLERLDAAGAAFPATAQEKPEGSQLPIIPI